MMEEVPAENVAVCIKTNAGLNFKRTNHRIVALDYNTGNARLAAIHDKLILGVVSDSYGVLLGGNDEWFDSGMNVVPVAVSGTVWVELNEMDNNKNYRGCLVGPGPDGLGVIVKRGQPSVGMVIDYDDSINLVKILVNLYR